MIKDFSNQDLRGLSFKGQDLYGAKFVNADIRGTNFSHANLGNTDFTGAKCGQILLSSILIFIVCLIVSFLSGNFSSLCVTDFIVTLTENGKPTPALTGGLIVYFIIYFVVYRYGSQRALIFILVFFALGFTALIATVVSGLRDFNENIVIKIIGISLISGILVSIMVLIYAIAIIIAYSISFYAALTCIIASISILFFGSNHFIPIGGVIHVLNAYIAWLAIKGDKRQSLILMLALRFVGFGCTKFRSSNLTNADFQKANLVNADFKGSTLVRTNWKNVDNYFLARFEETILSDYCVRTLLVTGIHNCESYTGKNLKGANLDGFDLSEIDLTEVDICEASLHGTKLINANLTRVQAIGTSFIDADLTGACIEGWNIDYTTKLNKVNCRYIYLLNGSRERRPTIGELGEGQFSLLFEKVFFTINSILGMKEQKDLISIFNEELLFNSCFISYSSKDEDFAKKLYHDLKINNVKCWFAPENIKIGEKIRTIIDESIYSYDKLLIILSENSVNSNWVEHEIETALDREISENHPILFPIRIDDAVMDKKIGWAAKIRRERNIGDFRDWMNNQKYNEAMLKLLHDLKAII